MAVSDLQETCEEGNETAPLRTVGGNDRDKIVRYALPLVDDHRCAGEGRVAT